MKQAFYYLREKRIYSKDGEIYEGIHKSGIVVLVADDELKEWARGVSLCNNGEDPFMKNEGFVLDKVESKKQGRSVYRKFEGGLKLAEDRAVKAFNSKASTESIATQQAWLKVCRTYVKGNSTRLDGIYYRSEYMPELNPFELRILKGEKPNGRKGEEGPSNTPSQGDQAAN